MYCSSCGAAVAPGLNYCKRCGVKLNKASNEAIAEPAAPTPDSLIWAIVAVFAVGLGGTIGLMAALKKVVSISDNATIPFALLSLFLMVVIEGFFLWLLLGGKRRAKRAEAPERLPERVPDRVNEQMIRDLVEAQTRAFGEHVPNIAEHTTYNLDPAPSREPKIQE